jgi:hypothetical protein
MDSLATAFEASWPELAKENMENDEGSEPRSLQQVV